MNNVKKIIDTIPNDVTLVAATKYVDSDKMKVLLENGINNFGENRVDSFLTKYVDLLDYDVTWHFIGHLQRNKAKLVVDKIDYLHSLDSLELAKIIDKLRDKPLNCFIEVNINEEESKNGVRLEDLDSFISEVIKYENINFSNHAYVMNAFIKIINSLKRLNKVKTKKSLCDVFQYTDM